MKRTQNVSSLFLLGLAGYGCASASTAPVAGEPVGTAASALVSMTDIKMCGNACGIPNSVKDYVPVLLSKTVDNNGKVKVDAAIVFACGANDGDLAKAFGYDPSILGLLGTGGFDSRDALKKSVGDAPIVTVTCDGGQISQVFRRIDPPAPGAQPQKTPADNPSPYFARFAALPGTLFAVSCPTILNQLWDRPPTADNLRDGAIAINASVMNAWGNGVEYRTLQCHSSPQTPAPTLPPPPADLHAGLGGSSIPTELHWVTGLADTASSKDLYVFASGGAFRVDCGANVLDAISALGFDPTTVDTLDASDPRVSGVVGGRKFGSIACDAPSARVFDTMNSPSNQYVDFSGTGATPLRFTCGPAAQFFASSVPPSSTFSVPEESVGYLSLAPNRAGAPAGVYSVGCNEYDVVRWATQEGQIWDAQNWFSGDFDGDGKTDVGKSFWDADKVSIDVHFSDGRTFNMKRMLTQGLPYRGDGPWVSGDFNGDSVSDVAQIWKYDGDTMIDVFVSTKTSFTVQSWWTKDGAAVDGQQWVAGDFDGDGRTDLATAFNDGGNITIQVYTFPSYRGPSSISPTTWVQKAGSWVQGKFVAGDFDGDGKADIAYVFAEGDSISIDVYASDGKRFTQQRWDTRDGGFDASQALLAGDFNGDGKSDIAIAWNDAGTISVDAHTSNGSSFTRGILVGRKGGPFGGQKWLAGKFTGTAQSFVAKVFPEAGNGSIDVFMKQH